jgi:hypothetical protein
MYTLIPEEIRATAATLPLPTNCYMPRAKGLPAIPALLFFLTCRSTTSTVGCILFGPSTAYTMGHTSDKHRRCPSNIFSFPAAVSNPNPAARSLFGGAPATSASCGRCSVLAASLTAFSHRHGPLPCHRKGRSPCS